MKKMFGGLVLLSGFFLLVGTLLLSNSGCGEKAPMGPAPTPTCVAASGSYGITGNTNNLLIYNIAFAIKVNFPNNVQVTDLQTYACSSDGTTPQDMDAGIYSDVAGAPGTLLAPAVTMPVTACGTYTFTLASNLVLKRGDYWLAVGGTDGDTRHYFVQTGVSAYAVAGGPLPTTFPTTTPYTLTSEIWANWICP